MKFLQNRQDETVTNYLLLVEVIFSLLAGIFILHFSKVTFYNYLSRIPYILAFYALVTLLVFTQKKKARSFKYPWVIELIISIIYLVLILNFLKYEYQYLFKLTIIMPVIILSLKYGLKMAFFAAFLSIGATFYLSYLRNFATIDADIILSVIMILLAWLLGQMTDTQYRIRSNLHLEIASRQKVETKHKNQLCFLQNLIDTIPNPIYYTNLNFVFTGCNTAFKDFFGITEEDITNRTIWDVLPIDIARRICNLGIMFTQNDLPKFEVTLTNCKGSIREVIFNNAIIHDNESKITGLLGVIIDITEQKQFQKEIARVERLNLVGEMAAGIAHEIRNPIATVKGFLQLYQMKSNITTLHNNVDLMIDELDRANTIITEYLSLAKGKALNLTSKNLNDIITSIAPLIIADATMFDKEVVFKLGRLPEALLDEDQIRQMLLNLCRNGLEAMEPGGTLTISTFLKNTHIVLRIKDQGKGIDPEIEDKIGTPFVTDKENGTGLGLAVCYSIATRHNASITYNTGPKGTTFSVKFKSSGQVVE